MSKVIYDFLRSQILPLKEIDDVVPKSGKILDLGCGQGVIASYLAKVKSRQVIGVDNDRKRLLKSNFQNLKFEFEDIRKYPLIGTTAIIISDVLHHLNYQDQKKLLSKIAKSLKRDGILLIKEIDTGEFIRSSLSRFWDFVFYQKDKIYYHNSDDLKKKLEKLGFTTTITRPTRLFPGSTTLLVSKKL